MTEYLTKQLANEVFEHTTKTIVDGILKDIKCSVFAYGATGAGKTYTMLGNMENPGVTFLTMMELYKRINEVREEKSCEVAVSYCEVYNETIRDMIVPSGDPSDFPMCVCIYKRSLVVSRSVV